MSIRYLLPIIAVSMFSLLVGPESLLGNNSFTAPPVALDRNHTMVISGIIGGGNLVPLGVEIGRRVAAGDRDLQLVIDSPGGETTTGFAFISSLDAARASGMHVTCFVPTIAASMAFQILLHCDERHVLRYSYLLWHRARISVMMATFSALELAPLTAELLRLDWTILSEVASVLATDMPGEDIEYSFNHETLHMGQDLAAMAPSFATAHAAIPGLMEVLRDVSVPRNPSLDRRHTNRSGQITYIPSRYQLDGGE